VKERVVVTGGRGMLGKDLVDVLTAEGTEVLALDLPTFDVRDPVQVRESLEAYRPARVIHLAAMTNVDGCELDPDAAYRTNTLGTQHVAVACQRLGVELVYVSTLAVFDGDKPEAYTEFDTPNPRSVYSRSKYLAEQIVERLLEGYYIVRAGWLFGGGIRDKKFVAKIMAQARQQPEIKAVDDKFGSPTYTVDFASGLLKLMRTGLYGTYHLVNTGQPASRYEVARHVVQFGGITDCRVVPVGSEQFPLPAPRPRMEAGRNYVLELRGCQWMRPWAEALRAYIETTLNGSDNG